MFNQASFIEHPDPFVKKHLEENPAPMFRRRFMLKAPPEKAVLSVCGLGYGYYYLNGTAVTQDLFTAPVSDYNKTLWYNTYDVTGQLLPGENLIAAILGNGFYNESMYTDWKHHEAPWRAAPKILLTLELTYKDGRQEHIVSDDSWLCDKAQSPVRFNQLRSGEIYDAGISESWRTPEYDDSGWVKAQVSETPPSGVLRECLCQPIRENREYKAVRYFQSKKSNWIFDFGQNMSGYVRLKISGPKGHVITVRYAEELKKDGSLQRKDVEKYANGYDFQTDRVICGGGETVWSPRFTYHGFRYVELEGASKPSADTVTAVFVHQAVEELSRFECSDEVVHKLYHMGKMATLSNLFYMPTDCPTREKLGWANDAQASAEQMLQNFDIAPLFEKWLQDILDAMREDGELPGIIPTPGWGYEWGSGPISSGVLFELPMQIYRYTGSTAAIRTAYPAFLNHIKYMASRADPNDGLIGYGLCDWAGPYKKPDKAPTPLKLTDTLLTIKFFRLTASAARICGDGAKAESLDAEGRKLLEIFKKAYLLPNGRCSVHEQTAVAMIVALEAYDKLEPLKEQLLELLSEKDFHHHCGMLGMQYLYPALDICGYQEEAYRIVTAKGRPSYTEWIEHDATTLWEMWHTGDSKNHHMHSCVLSWFMKTVLGLHSSEDAPGFCKAEIRPYFLRALTFCKGEYKTAAGTYAVSWQRQSDNTILLSLTVPKGAQACIVLNGYTCDRYKADGLYLSGGSYELLCKEITDERNM